MQAIIDRLMAGQADLARRPVGEILAVLDRVAASWLDRSGSVRREAEARLAGSTGLAPAMIGRGLDDMIRRMQGIGPLLDQDLGSRMALDGFVRRASGILSRAYGPGLLVCIFSGNVPGIPAFDMALALALKSACLARPAAGEPLFADLFARSVAAEDPGLGRCLAVARWEYEEVQPLQRAGAVLAYGSDQSLEAIRANVSGGTRFIGHGHKVSFAVVAREAADAQTAQRLAYDVAMYDQQGCVSPHVAFVERGGALAPREFARAVGEALAALQGEMPRGALSVAEAASLRAARDEAEFTADAVFGSPADLAWTVVHTEAPAVAPSPLNRLLRTCAVDDLGEMSVALKQVSAYLQTVAYAGPPARGIALAEALGALGASRFCPVGRAQEPSALWRHDGRPTAGDLVRWADMEEESV